MLVLVAVPAFYLAALAHRLLQLYAPSNLLARRACAAEPRWRAVAVLAAVAVGTLIASHGLCGRRDGRRARLAERDRAGARWDALKIALLTAELSARAIRRSNLAAVEPS